MISPKLHRQYDVLVATTVFGWKEETFTLLRGLHYNEINAGATGPIETGKKQVLVPADFVGDKTLHWHQFGEPIDKDVPNYSSDNGLAVRIMQRTSFSWGWKWLVDMDESRCAIKLRTNEAEPIEEAVSLIGPFALAVCAASIKGLGLEVPHE